MIDDIDWSPNKSAELQMRYGFGFDRLMAAAKLGGVIAERKHPNSERYPHQYQWVIDLDGYIWIVPFVRSEEGIFLKTFFPSRKATREYLGAVSHEERTDRDTKSGRD